MVQESTVEGSEKWAEFYSKGKGNRFPDENLVRLVRGDYAPLPTKGRVLDIGFGIGANLLFLAREGYEAHGLEVSSESIAEARRLAEASGLKVELDLMDGPGIPYPDEYFDIVLAWNSIYYHGTRSRVRQAVAEVHRSLAPGGAFLLSVLHPDSALAGRLSEDLGDGAHQVVADSDHDTRQGIRIFFDPSSDGWRKLLAPFDEVFEGGARFNLFQNDRRDAWRYFLARKQANP